MGDRVKFGPGATIDGVSVKQLRDLLLWMGTSEIARSRLKERASQLGLDRNHSLVLLEREGYIVKKRSANRIFFACTGRGLDFSHLKLTPQVSRTKANEHLRAFLTRVDEVNAENAWAYSVERVLLFGSMLSPEENVGDVDLAVQLGPREADIGLQHQRNIEFIRRAATAGRSFSNVTEEVCWPQIALFKFLKAGSRVIDLNFAESVIESGYKYRVIYDRQAT